MNPRATLLVLACLALPGCGPASGDDPVERRARAALASGGCGACHLIPGVPGARGNAGPPLANLSGRIYIAGRLPNTPESLAAWIENAPAFEPRTAMPAQLVNATDARAIAEWLLRQ